jgi:cytochrome P450
MAELTRAVEEEGLQWPITYADACKLDYFQACLKEALRLHSAVPWTLPRVVPVGGAVLCGHFFPAGTEVAMSPFVVHRRTEAFGPDARTYRPERWLDADAATKKEMERNLLTFGAGARVCIGQSRGKTMVRRVRLRVMI